MTTTVRFTEDHEYVRIEGATGIVGITDFAQGQLGDIVFVELPALGKVLKRGEEAAVVESVKAASEVYAPISGKVIAVNNDLAGDPGLINRDPAGEGWLFQLEVADQGEAEALMDEGAYGAFAR